MRNSQNLLAILVAGLLAACAVAWYVTRDAAKKPAASNQTPLVDDRLLQTARRISSVADTSEEQELAREALRLADHELDQAFASALREATAASAPASGPLKQVADHILQLKARIAADQGYIARLAKEAAASDAAAGQLELAKAQLALDEDELEDAQQDLARQGGDKHTKLERALQEHEAVQRETAQLPKVSTASSPATLWEQVQLWLSLSDREHQLEAARQQAAGKASALEREHDALEKLINNRPASEPSVDSLARLRGLSAQRKTLTELDKRIQDSQHLSDVYKRWRTVVEMRQRGVVHLLLSSLAAVLAILLTVILTVRAIHRAFGQQKDRRRLHQLRAIASVTVQLLGAFLIALIIFGLPSQMSTLIGLATAGLTVALKDFIVAFFGWFTLIGRNGIRVGDWVEIEGVGGEVIEIGLLRTVLLEMGNWTNASHPTGRRVTFLNSFALGQHYFNFSTTGLWLWDELKLTLPATGDPYRMALEIRETVARETETDAKLAEQDWQRVTHQYGVRPFSAKPAVDLRPSVNGLDVIVRYITRAPQRYEVKSRLFQAIVDLLHKPAGSALGTT